MRKEKKVVILRQNLAVIPACSLLHCDLNPSTQAHAGHVNDSILNCDHSLKSSKAILIHEMPATCYTLRQRIHPIP